jgi:hypothetical protein
MDLARWFDNPFNRTDGSLTLPIIAFVLSVAVGLFLRRMEWSGAAVLAAMIGSVSFFVMYSAFHGIGPLSVMGLGMMFVWALVVTIPTVGLIRLLMRWIAGKPKRAE